MNQEERDWLEWLKRAQDWVVTQRQAAEKMEVSERWVRRQPCSDVTLNRATEKLPEQAEYSSRVQHVEKS